MISNCAKIDFVEYLNEVNDTDRPHLVLTRAEQVVACGGLIINPDSGEARLSWGMAQNALHGTGLGTKLTEARLAIARNHPGITEIGLSTSQHTHGFYERFGFVATRVMPDGLAPGLDQWDMTLRLGDGTKTTATG